MNRTYSQACTEVLEVISYFSEDELKKIPQYEINFLNENKDSNYQFTVNPGVDLAEQNISFKANAILISLYRDYFADEEQKKDLEKWLKQNEQKSEEEKRLKYNPDAIFKQEEKIIKVESINVEENKELLPVDISEKKWYQKIIDFIKSFLNKKN